MRARTERRCCSPESHQDILTTVLKDRPISKRQRPALIKSDPAKRRTLRSKLGFAKDQRSMRTGPESSGWQPNRGDASSRSIGVVAHLARQDHSAGAAQLLVVGHSSGG